MRLAINGTRPGRYGISVYGPDHRSWEDCVMWDCINLAKPANPVWTIMMLERVERMSDRLIAAAYRHRIERLWCD